MEYPASMGPSGSINNASQAAGFSTALRLSEDGQPSYSASFPFVRRSGRQVVRNICYISAGYVGGPSAAVTAYHNPRIRVAVVDKDVQRIRQWNSKHLPIHEPGLREIVRLTRDGSPGFVSTPEDDQDARSTSYEEEGPAFWPETIRTVPRQPNLFFSVEVDKYINKADIVIIAVNTPAKSSGIGAGRATDMAAFEAVVLEIAQHARAGTIIVEKSTVPCGTARLIQDIMSVHRPNDRFEILSNPEFLSAGTAVQDLMYPGRVLIGSSQTLSGHRAAQSLLEVYAAWVPRPCIFTMDTWSSELAKLVSNAMLAQRISSINSISAICEKIGADIGNVATSVGSDPRIGKSFLKAGAGFGGSCFKKDVLSLAYIADALGLPEISEYWQQVIKLNEYQRDRFARRIIGCLNNNLVGKKLTVFGFSFKANTSDMRESLALGIIKSLLDEEPREIAIFDPCCNPALIKAEIRKMLGDQRVLREVGGRIEVYSDAYSACAGSNAIIITTDCDAFKIPERTVLSSQVSMPNGHYSSGSVSEDVTGMDFVPYEGFGAAREPPGPGSSQDGPLGPFREEPACAEDCPECALLETSGYPSGGAAEGSQARLDWVSICFTMKTPKWLFDGKGVIDPARLEMLDISVESIGRRGRL